MPETGPGQYGQEPLEFDEGQPEELSAPEPETVSESAPEVETAGPQTSIDRLESRIAGIAEYEDEINAEVSPAQREATAPKVAGSKTSAEIFFLNQEAAERAKSDKAAERREKLDEHGRAVKERYRAVRQKLVDDGWKPPLTQGDLTVKEAMAEGQVQRDAHAADLEKKAQSAAEAEEKAKKAARTTGKKHQWPIMVDDEAAAQQAADQLAEWKSQQRGDKT